MFGGATTGVAAKQAVHCSISKFDCSGDESSLTDPFRPFSHVETYTIRSTGRGGRDRSWKIA